MIDRTSRIILIVQARMNSTRLPGKILLKVLDIPLLGFQIQRLQRVRQMTEIVLATSRQATDEPLLLFCKETRIPLYRGSEENVLERYYEAAKSFSADIVIRISGDCPLIDPAIVDQGISMFIDNFPCYDYISNTHQRTFPRGMDVEIFTFDALKKSYEEAQSLAEKEHVTPYIYRHPELFKIGQFLFSSNQSDYRLTVDTLEDFHLIKKILEELYPVNPEFTLEDILELLRLHPDWVKINSHIQQKNVESH